MKTIKIQVEETQTVKKEVEFKLPCFRKNENSVFHIRKDKKCVEVQNFIFDVTIQFRDIASAFREGTKESTEAEFNQAFEKAITQFKNL